ncbi:MAG: hypothetical protein COT34_00210 [Candidatus Nealsonbacteria bacterium CG08_land_8_20_14_0_20_43_11]|uniref:DUF167 domain-containing protein n=1 Tax=Candidatus Nealsonbacteria bacterium CG08_land_8_20_14_0_20_43_11 TaxID=1974706 RepID=A0A2M6T1K8_9BACT|nr:MAG: hypothetical protein COT34_00210 [Candidatus Nealsonbacteria bacterium CG08_land_8_20_14_0_20_43_11]
MEDRFEIYTKEKPQKGEANKRAKAVLAAFFNVKEERIRLIKGFQERNKIFEIYGPKQS